MAHHNLSRRSLLDGFLGGFFGLFAARKVVAISPGCKPLPVFNPIVYSADCASFAGQTHSFTNESHDHQPVWSTYLGGKVLSTVWSPNPGTGGSRWQGLTKTDLLDL